jgi:hypothetical protein
MMIIKLIIILFTNNYLFTNIFKYLFINNLNHIKKMFHNIKL